MDWCSAPSSPNINSILTLAASSEPGYYRKSYNGIDLWYILGVSNIIPRVGTGPSRAFMWPLSHWHKIGNKRLLGGGSKNHSSCGFSMVGHLCLQYSRRNPLFQGQPFQLACSSKDAVQDDQGDQHLHMGGFSIGACWWPALPPYSYPLPCHTCILSHGRHCFKPATEHGTQQPGLLLHGPSSGLQCRWLLPHGGCVLQSAVILGGTSTTCFALCTWCPLPFQLTGICHFMRLARLGDHLWFELPALPCNGLPGSHGWRQSLPIGQFRLGLAWAPVYT